MSELLKTSTHLSNVKYGSTNLHQGQCVAKTPTMFPGQINGTQSLSTSYLIP